MRIWGFGDSFALLTSGQFELLSPELSDGAGPVRMGSEEAVELLKRSCSWTTPPYPQSQPVSLLATLWVGYRSSVYGHKTEPGAIHQEGDKSVEAVPWRALTCKACAKLAGRVKLAAWASDT